MQIGNNGIHIEINVLEFFMNLSFMWVLWI